MTENIEQNYPFLMSVGTLLLAEELTKLESRKKHRQKMERVIAKKRAMLGEAFPLAAAEFMVEGDGFIITENLDGALKFEWSVEQASTFIIDLAFSNPFAPYELSYSNKSFQSALIKVGELVGITAEGVRSILKTKQEAIKVHSQIGWGKIAVAGIGGLVVLGLGGWLSAPAIGGAIGAAAGLYGAAATSHGLAILGGGSLAIGGMGMAGGMWVVAGTGATVGLLSAGGATLLLELGAARAKVELIKLQVSYKEVVLGTQTELKKAQEIIKSLARQRDEIKAQLNEERELNDKNATRVKEIEATLKAMEEALDWMKSKYDQTVHKDTVNGEPVASLLESQN